VNVSKRRERGKGKKRDRKRETRAKEKKVCIQGAKKNRDSRGEVDGPGVVFVLEIQWRISQLDRFGERIRCALPTITISTGERSAAFRFCATYFDRRHMNRIDRSF